MKCTVVAAAAYDNDRLKRISSQKILIKCLKQSDRKKSPIVYKSCPKMISLEKLPKNVGDLGKSIVAKWFEQLPKVQ